MRDSVSCRYGWDSSKVAACSGFLTEEGEHGETEREGTCITAPSGADEAGDARAGGEAAMALLNGAGVVGDELACKGAEIMSSDGTGDVGDGLAGSLGAVVALAGGEGRDSVAGCNRVVGSEGASG